MNEPNSGGFRSIESKTAQRVAKTRQCAGVELAAVLFNSSNRWLFFPIHRIVDVNTSFASVSCRPNTCYFGGQDAEDGAGLARTRSDFSFRRLASGWDWR